MTMVMVMTAVSIVISVIVLDLHHHEPTHHVPDWLRALVFGFMARLLCIYTPYSTERTKTAAHGSSRMQGRHRHSSRSSRSCTHAHNWACDDEQPVLTSVTSEHNGVEAGVTMNVKYLYDELDALTTGRQKTPLLEEILQHLRGITAKIKTNIRRDAIKEEWQMLAKIIDRFLLVIFLLAITTLTLVILYIYPQVTMHSHSCAR